MSAIKFSILAIALVAAATCAQAAGGIKGRPLQAAADSQPGQAAKGPALRPPPQQQYLVPQQAQQQQAQQAIKAGPGQVAPVFNAVRVQPIQQQQQQQEQIVQQQQQQEPEQQQQVQVQQQEEIDPNAAAQDNAPAIAALATPARAAPSEEEANPRPEPYAFQYAFEAGDSATSGSSQREEQQDANGRVTGFYTLKGEDGRDRRVDYVADASGFRATISTNEMGTAPKDSADVDWNAQNPTDGQLRAAESATQAARQRALLNPQQQQQIPSGSSNNFSKLSSPRSKASPVQQQQYNGGSSASNQQSGKQNLQQQQQQQQQQLQQQQPQQEIVQQLQEPFEQIRQTELNARARKSRHAPFYLFTV